MILQSAARISEVMLCANRVKPDLGPFTNGGHSIQDQLKLMGVNNEWGHSEWEMNLN